MIAGSLPSARLPTGRRGQALAAGLMILLLAVLWFGVLDPVREWYDDRAMQLDRREALLNRMREVVATLPALQAASSAKLNREQEPGAAMLPGASDAVAAADLQERVQTMASSAGVNLTAVETLPATQAGPWHKVSLRISMNAPWPVLMRLLRSIGEPPAPNMAARAVPARILIDDVHFHSTALATHPTVLPIQASMVVYGFRQASPDAKP